MSISPQTKFVTLGRLKRALPGLSACGLVLALAACEAGPSIDRPEAVTKFEEVATGFTHQWAEPSHPFTGAAAIDVDGDGADEVFIGGGLGQKDALLKFANGAFVDQISGSGLEGKTGATHGVLSSDVDLDGDVDLIIARDTGVSIYLNNGGKFIKKPVPVKLAKDAVALSVAASDMDQDGDLDLYISAFVAYPAFASATFNDPNHAKRNIVLTNNGDLTFTDTTDASGAGGLQNTFHATFVNLDKDKDLDLVLAQNTGEIEIFENQGNGKFLSRPTKSGYGFWMGIGVGDIEQDGDQDLLVSNAGISIPDILTTGDLRDDQRHNVNWALLRNDGGFQFKDVISERNLDEYGFAWGAVFEDVNQDGTIDLLVAQNYIKWPIHKVLPLPGKALLQLDGPAGQEFYNVKGLNLENRHYGQSPMIADVNGDGRPDVLWLNMDGPLRVLLNKGSSPFLTLRIPDDMRAQGAEVRAHLTNGTVLRRQVVASTGLMTDSTSSLFFGIPSGAKVARIEVVPLTGAPVTINAPELNRTLDVQLP